MRQAVVFCAGVGVGAALCRLYLEMMNKSQKQKRQDDSRTGLKDEAVAVGSHNPVKVNSVAAALKRVFPGRRFHVFGYSVPSGVPDQPMGDAQTKQGAINRAKAAAKAHAREHGGEACVFSVGLEGGLSDETVGDAEEREMRCMAWLAVFKPSPESPRHPQWGLANTASFLIPFPIARLVRGGQELGDADDEYFGRRDSKKSSGTVGILTNDVVDRTAYYEHALVLAFVPFVWPKLYPRDAEGGDEAEEDKEAGAADEEERVNDDDETEYDFASPANRFLRRDFEGGGGTGPAEGRKRSVRWGPGARSKESRRALDTFMEHAESKYTKEKQ